MDRAAFAVGQWTSERPDLDTLPMLVLGRLGEANNLIRRDRVEPLFASFGLQAGEFDVLATLRRAGAPYAMTPTALYQATMISSGAMTNRLDRLEKAGLIARAPDPQDRRGTIVSLTKKGRGLIDRALDAHVENQRKVLAGLTRSEQKALADLLGKLIASQDEEGKAG
mgnify:CR=1 FL=1